MDKEGCVILDISHNIQNYQISKRDKASPSRLNTIDF